MKKKVLALILSSVMAFSLVLVRKWGDKLYKSVLKD